MATFQTYVAAVDFSETSLDAAKAAAEMARERKGRVHLIHVVPNVFESPWMTSTHGLGLTELQRDLVKEAERRLIAMTATEPFRDVDTIWAVGTGSASEAIVRYATEQHADLIVMGTHGYGPIKRFLLGHEADRVIRHARCPVLTMPHKSLLGADSTHAAEPESVAAR